MLVVVAAAAATSALAQNASTPLPPYTGSTDMTTEGQNATTAPMTNYGTGTGVSTNLLQPLSTSASMSTVDGTQTFGAQVGCSGSTQYMQLTLFTSSTGDVSQVAIDQDPGLTGSYTNHELLTGPFAGICANGLIHCDPGTFSNCSYLQWTASSNSIALTPVSQETLGACYCVNNYCGSNLAITNGHKLLSDMGAGITYAETSVYPRLAIASSSYPDPVTEVFFGSNTTGCATTTTPETYFNNGNTGQITTAGQSIASDPTTGYNMVLNSPAGTGDQVAQSSCALTQTFDLTSVSKNQVIQVISRSAGATSDCGAGCLQVVLGNQTSSNYWTAGSTGQGCGLYSDSMQVQIKGGQYVTSATLQQFNVDDYGQEVVNGTLTWIDPQTASWTNPNQSWKPGGNCDSYQINNFTPNVDETAYFNQDGVVTVKNNDSVGGTGRAWSVTQFMVHEGCQIADSYVNDTCASFEANTNCRLQNETVDGVPTVQNYVATGLVPVPQTQDVKTSVCDYGQLTEPYFVKQRTYVCQVTAPNYDFTDAVQRWTSIDSSLNPTNGNYTDRTVTQQGGTPTYSQAQVTLPPSDPAPSCTPSCETSTAGPGVNVGDVAGAASTLNSTGVPIKYSFKACTAAGVCPVNPGETVVEACQCRNDFSKAASMMQTMRMMGQDSICTQP